MDETVQLELQTILKPIGEAMEYEKVLEIYKNNNLTEQDTEEIGEKKEEEVLRNTERFRILSRSIQEAILRIRATNNSFNQFRDSYNKRNLQDVLFYLKNSGTKCIYSNSLLLYNDEELSENEDDLSFLGSNIEILKITDNNIYISTKINLTRMADPYFNINFPIKLVFTVVADKTEFRPFIRLKQYEYNRSTYYSNPLHPYITDGYAFNPFSHYPIVGVIDPRKPLSFAINDTIKTLNTYTSDLLVRDIKYYTGPLCLECNGWTYGEYVTSNLTGNHIHSECSILDKNGRRLELSRVKLCRKCNNHSELFIPVDKNTFECTECIDA